MYIDIFNIKRLDIAFDYDGTLTEEIWQMTAKGLQNKHRLWIITARSEHANNSDLFSAAEEINIPKERIVFTNSMSKVSVCKKNKIDIIFDNNTSNCHDLLSNKITAVLV